LFLGLYTDCCQHLDGAGASCAWHGATDINGGFYVVEDKKGTIVAQSWIWRNGRDVCFDNIECLGDIENRSEILKKLYFEVANKMLGVLCITQVNVGTGYDNSGFINEIEFAYEKFIPVSPAGYSDARNDQRVLAIIEEPTPLEEFVF